MLPENDKLCGSACFEIPTDDQFLSCSQIIQLACVLVGPRSGSLAARNALDGAHGEKEWMVFRLSVSL